MVTLPAVDIVPLKGGPVLRWGILAPGGIAGSWATGVTRHTDQRIVAVASRSLDRATAFAERFEIARAYDDYELLVADPEVDIVYVAAPHSEHRRLALLAIAAGKHVLVEKPMAPSAAEAREIVDAARAAGVFAMEAMWTRFLPQSSIVARMLADGAFGEVVSASASFGFRAPVDPAGRLFNPALAGGALLDIGVYTAWFSHFALGAPERVTTRGTLAATGVDDQSVTVLDFASGAQSALRTSLRVALEDTATIEGTEGRMRSTGPFWAPSSFAVTIGDNIAEFTDDSGITGGDGLAYQAVAVAQHIADGLTESAKHPLDTTLAVLTVLDDARTQLGYPPAPVEN